MKTINIIFLAIGILTVIGCAAPEKYLVKQLSFRGEVLNEYESEGDQYAIVKEGNNINMYRIVKYKAAGIATGYTEKLYTIDNLTKECYKYINSANIIEIDCAKLQNDEHLKEYIN